MNFRINNTWLRRLAHEFEQDYFIKLVEKVRSAYENNPGKIFPRSDEIFKAFDLCPFDKVKVVILGQDPYPTKGHAHGLCFSVNETVKPLPKSLKNIFAELHNDIEKTLPCSGDLTPWAKQGVFLLNVTLTVQEGLPDSHKSFGWQKFTDQVIREISMGHENIVFILWGTKAISKKYLIDQKKHLILESVHPSPLSAHRGFFGNRHFSKTNEFLERRNITPIEW